MVIASSLSSGTLGALEWLPECVENGKAVFSKYILQLRTFGMAAKIIKKRWIVRYSTAHIYASEMPKVDTQHTQYCSHATKFEILDSLCPRLIYNEQEVVKLSHRCFVFCLVDHRFYFPVRSLVLILKSLGEFLGKKGNNKAGWIKYQVENIHKWNYIHILITNLKVLK